MLVLPLVMVSTDQKMVPILHVFTDLGGAAALQGCKTPAELQVVEEIQLEWSWEGLSSPFREN